MTDSFYSWFIRLLYTVVILCTCLLLFLRFPNLFEAFSTISFKQKNELAIAEFVQLYENDPYFELIEAPGVEIVRKQCLGCHSPRLIVQNKMTRDRWSETIDWMQETQGLWDLGEDETIIIEYLVSNYAPLHTGRRQTLNYEAIEWYILNPE